MQASKISIYVAIIVSFVLTLIVFLPKEMNVVKAQETSASNNAVYAQAPGVNNFSTVASIFFLFRTAQEIEEKVANVQLFNMDSVISGLLDSVVVMICNNGEDPVRVNELMGMGGNQAGCNPTIGDMLGPDEGVAYNNGSSLSTLAAISAYNTVNEPIVPVNMALYINSTFGNTIFGTPSFAQTLDPSSLLEDAVIHIWRVTRNIAVSFLALFVGIGALGVMFRQRLGAQNVVTIYNLLPYVPVVFLLIVLSYPIMVVAINSAVALFGLGNTIAVDLGSAILAEAGGGDLAPNNLLQTAMQTGFNVIVALLATRLQASVAAIMITILVLIAFIVMIFTYLVQLIKVYVRFILYTIFMPLVMLSAILPGRQNVIFYFLKKVFLEVIILPLIVFNFFIAMFFIILIGSTGFTLFEGFKVLTMIILFGIAWGIIMSTGKIRSQLEGMLGVGGKSLFMVDTGEKRR